MKPHQLMSSISVTVGSVSIQICLMNINQIGLVLVLQQWLLPGRLSQTVVVITGFKVSGDITVGESHLNTSEN